LFINQNQQSKQPTTTENLMPKKLLPPPNRAVQPKPQQISQSHTHYHPKSSKKLKKKIHNILTYRSSSSRLDTEKNTGAQIKWF
jgi:Holliday junction resolvase RusA-like endonuclease